MSHVSIKNLNWDYKKLYTKFIQLSYSISELEKTRQKVCRSMQLLNNKHFGNYYKKIKDYNNMKKYYLKAIDFGDIYALYALGSYYYEIEDFENMKKYYMAAIKKGSRMLLKYWQIITIKSEIIKI